MSKRLDFLQKLIDSGKADTFARYAFALELKSLGRLAESLTAFDALRSSEPAYVPQYLMAGGIAESLGQRDAALGWYDDGIERARASGDGHALSELTQARSLLG